MDEDKINDRLNAVEGHIVEAKALRTQLIEGFQKLNDRVEKIDDTIFGGEKEVGMYHQVIELNKTATFVKNILIKILWVAVSYLIIAALPYVASFFNTITHLPKG